MKTNIKAFTLVEVVVVTVILAIIAAISFVSFTSYVSWSRDSRRVVDVESVSTALEVYYKNNWWIFPRPSDAVLISFTWSDWNIKPFAYLGFIKNQLGLSFNSVPRDPVTQDYYSYWITVDKKFYEITCTLENPPENVTSFNVQFQKAYAEWTDYAYVAGNYKKNTETWYFPDHIVLLEKDWSVYKIPRKDTNIGNITNTWTGDIFAPVSNVTFIENWKTNVPYPIYNKDRFISVSNSSSSGSFLLESTETWIILKCPWCK